jgi:hypothetical protein
MVSSYDLVYVLTYAVPALMFLFAAYWAFSIRSALAVRLYRNQAFGIGLIALCFAIFFVVIGIPNDVYNTNNPVISLHFFIWLSSPFSFG